jgi:hypothetical protein
MIYWPIYSGIIPQCLEEQYTWLFGIYLILVMPALLQFRLFLFQ